MPRPWNVEVRVGGAKQPEQGFLEKSFEESPFPQIAVERSLEPTLREHRAIALANDGLRYMFGRLGLPPHDVPEKRIHIVTDEQIRAFGGWDEQEGLTLHGHVFIKRRIDLSHFYQDLTHEIVHAASFYALQVQKKKGKNLAIWDRRLGFSFRPKSEAGSSAHFNGLSEGVTELMAHHLRRTMGTEQSGLTETEIQQMRRRVFYGPWVRIASAIPNIIAKSEVASADDVETDLYRDYVTGSYRILKRLERARPGTAKALMPLVQTSGDALVAAELLGLHALAAELRTAVRV